ncbi:ribonuclease H2, subunit C [Mycena galopus ATCC 62051]|nr:ribonuclease H2, subunit C [Mycena galopus ATCC 62051]
MAAPTLSIAPISSSKSLPDASPNLMPFHVDHNGPAPISTYFLVDAAPENVAKPPPPPASAEDVEMEPVADSADTDVSPKVTEPSEDKSFVRRVTDATTRFIATFRGRTMQGLKVDLPAGYIGVIMAAPAPGKASAAAGRASPCKVKAKPRGSKTRATRSATRGDTHEVEDDEVTEDGQNRRTLMPTAQFSSFVLWNPDIPVDPGRDEYLRSFTEWIRLADEIHRIEE